MQGRTNGRMDARRDRRTDGRKDEFMGERMDGGTLHASHHHSVCEYAVILYVNMSYYTLSYTCHTARLDFIQTD